MYKTALSYSRETILSNVNSNFTKGQGIVYKYLKMDLFVRKEI